MSKKVKGKLSAQVLLKKGVPYILIPGILAAAALGWKTGTLDKIKNYYEMKTLFPSSGIVSKIEDGDTFNLRGGQRIRLLAVDAPDGISLAENFLTGEVLNKKVYLEYDRYQDDKYGRVLAWVWMGCEKTPKFLSADYMHKNQSESMPGLTENPEGCKKGKLINEVLVENGFAKIVSYQDRGELKYELRLKGP